MKVSDAWWNKKPRTNSFSAVSRKKRTDHHTRGRCFGTSWMISDWESVQISGKSTASYGSKGIRMRSIPLSRRYLTEQWTWRKSWIRKKSCWRAKINKCRASPRRRKRWKNSRCSKPLKEIEKYGTRRDHASIKCLNRKIISYAIGQTKQSATKTKSKRMMKRKTRNGLTKLKKRTWICPRNAMTTIKN